MQQFDPLGAEYGRQKTYAGDVPAGPVHTLHEAETDRIGADGEDDGNVRACVLRSAGRSYIAGCRNHAHVEHSKLLSQLRQQIVVSTGPTLFDAHVLAVDEALLTEALAE